jgi:hypothetical protein
MSKPILRICITSNDIIKIEECSVRTATQKMSDMRVFFDKKEKRCKITFKDYAEYSRIPLDDLEPFRLISSSAVVNFHKHFNTSQQN